MGGNNKIPQQETPGGRDSQAKLPTWNRRQLCLLGLAVISIATAVNFVFSINGYMTGNLNSVVQVAKLYNNLLGRDDIQQENDTSEVLWPCFDPTSMLNHTARKQCRLVTFDLSKTGRLGNCMYAYAAMLGISRYLSATPIIALGGKRSLVDSVFNIRALSSKPLYSSQREQVVVKAKPELAENMSHVLDAVPDNCDVYLKGFFHSWLLFKDVDPLVREEFTFKPSIRDRAADTLAGMIRAASEQSAQVNYYTTVGIHVRKGKAHVKWGLGNMRQNAEDYLFRVTDYFTKRPSDKQDPSKIFVICSDDISWATNVMTQVQARHLAHDGRRLLVAYCPAGPAGVDMAVLASCNHTVMTMGTFGWWSTYLSLGTKVYYADSTRHYTFAGTAALMNDNRYQYPVSWISL